MSVNAAARRAKKPRNPRPGSWEASHPPVSLRVTLWELQQLRALAAFKGVGLSDILREGLGISLVQIAPWRAAGFGRFNVPCSRCGKPMLIDLFAQPEFGPILAEALRAYTHAPYCPP